MLEPGSSYNLVVFFTEIIESFSIIIDVSYAVLSHHTLPVTVVISWSGIHISQKKNTSMCCAGASSVKDKDKDRLFYQGDPFSSEAGIHWGPGTIKLCTV